MTDPGSRRRARPLTIVCHLLAEPAAESRIVGHVEDVEELLALITHLATAQLVD